MISLVAGILGLVLGLPFVFEWMLAPVAVVTGHMALSGMRRTPGVGGRGVAITGLVLGYVGLGILALYLAIFLFVGIVFGFANIF